MSAADETVSDGEREYLLARRQALLIDLAAIEKRLKLKRSIVSKHQRESRRCDVEMDAESEPIV